MIIDLEAVRATDIPRVGGKGANLGELVRAGFPVPDGDFHTVAGMVLSIINRIPRTGDVFTHEGWTVEVADMDAMRIDRLIVTAPAAEN